MVDDPSKRRARTQGDARDRRTPLGTPVYVDPELTPPPQEPPPPPGVEGIPPAIQRALETHAEKFAELNGWLQKLAPLRDEDRLDRMETNIGAIAANTNRHQSMLDDMLVPQLDRWRAMTDELHGQVPRLIASIEQMAILVGNIEQRIRAVEITVSKMVDRIDGDSKNYEKWFAAAERDREHLRSRVEATEDRIDGLERVERDRVVTQQALAKVDRKKSRKAGGVVGGAAAAVVGVVWKVLEHFHVM